MARTHRRKTVLAGAALVAAAALLTACGQPEAETDGSAKPGTESSAGKDGGSAETGEGAGSAAPEEGEAAKAGPEQEAGTEQKAGSEQEAGKGEPVTGTWLGTVSYLAPGKYTVSDMKDTKQAFFTSENTDIQGAGDICGDENGQAATPCSEAELEAAAKKGVSAKVELKDGIAVSIIDDK